MKKEQPTTTDSSNLKVGDVVSSADFRRVAKKDAEQLPVGDTVYRVETAESLSVEKPDFADAQFVVEKAESGPIPDGGVDYSLVARRLKSDGTYDPDGELISFSGGIETTIHGRMQRSVHFE